MPEETTTTTTTTTTSTTTTTTLLPSRALQQLENFIDSIYPRYVLRNNKLPFDLIKLGNSEVFSIVQTSSLPSWLDIETAGIKGVPTSNTTTSAYITVINYKEPQFLNARIYITYTQNNSPTTISFPITKNNQIFTLDQGITYTSFYIAKTEVISGSTKTVILYSYNVNENLSDDIKNYDYIINNAYCDVYERTGLESRTFRGTFPIFKIPDADRQNYNLIVDLEYRNLYSVSLQNLVSNANYQLELRFKNLEGSYSLQGSYDYIVKLPTDNLVIGVDTLLAQTIKNISSLETLTEILILLAKLRYANKKTGNNYIDDYFDSLLNVVKMLPRVGNLFYSKYSFDEVNEKIIIFNDPINLSRIELYPNLYMVCRFLESKDADLINFVQTSGILTGIYQCIETNQPTSSTFLNYSNLVRRGFSIQTTENVASKGPFLNFFLLKDQVLLYILYTFLNAKERTVALQDRINLMYNKADNTAHLGLSEIEGISIYNPTTLDYIWANYFYSALNLNNNNYAAASALLATWSATELQNLQASSITLNRNLQINSADYNADYDIDFSDSGYPQTALTYSSQTQFAYTPYTIMYDYLQRKASQGNFLNNYETTYGVLLANRGYAIENIYITPNLFSTVLQILSKISPTDYFAVKTEFISSQIPTTEMIVNYYPVTNGVLVTVSLQYALGVVAITSSTDGSTVFDKKIITTPSNTHSFVINAPKTTGFILSVNPIIQTV
jgi:hypothetical protein